MRALLLAGGHGTRLGDLTQAKNKHMLTVGDRPMLGHALQALSTRRIDDLGIVVGRHSRAIIEYVGDGGAWGFDGVTYIRQPEPLGLAHAILRASMFLRDEPFLMYLGDNLLEAGVEPFLDTYSPGVEAVLGAVEVPNPQAFGVVELDKDNHILGLEEKPEHPRSNLALVGVYIFGETACDVARTLRPSARGEYEITDLIRGISAEGREIRVLRLKGWWNDMGTPESIAEAEAFIARR